jgi:hypothetical protein
MLPNIYYDSFKTHERIRDHKEQAQYRQDDRAATGTQANRAHLRGGNACP